MPRFTPLLLMNGGAAAHLVGRQTALHGGRVGVRCLNAVWGKEAGGRRGQGLSCVEFSRIGEKVGRCWAVGKVVDGCGAWVWVIWVGQ